MPVDWIIAQTYDYEDNANQQGDYMGTTIIPSPARTVDVDRLASVAKHTTSAIPLPAGADTELDMLLRIREELLRGVNDKALDRLLALVADWEDNSLTGSRSAHSRRSMARLHKLAFPA